MAKKGHSDPLLSAYFTMLVNAYEGLGTELAEATGVPRSGISQIRNGTYGTGLVTLRKIATWRKMTPEALQADARAWDAAGRPAKWSPAPDVHEQLRDALARIDELEREMRSLSAAATAIKQKRRVRLRSETKAVKHVRSR